jgi:hypothetical protein
MGFGQGGGTLRWGQVDGDQAQMPVPVLLTPSHHGDRGDTEYGESHEREDDDDNIDKGHL